MPRIKKVCRVCGKEYEACRTVSKTPDVFRWQEVACSPECGAKYLYQIQVSRGEVKTSKTSENVTHSILDAQPVADNMTAQRNHGKRKKSKETLIETQKVDLSDKLMIDTDADNEA